MAPRLTTTPRGTGTYERIYAVVRRIPRGQVATYGQVATLAGLPGRARQVGYALHALRGATNVPWHRVVNAAGRLSLGAANPAAGVEQRIRLAREGVLLVGGRVSLASCAWRPRKADRAPSDARPRRGRSPTATEA